MNKQTKYFKYTVELERIRAWDSNHNHYKITLDGKERIVFYHIVEFNTLEPLTFIEFEKKLEGTNNIVNYEGYFKPEYILTEVIPNRKFNNKLEVSQEVIDFLDLQDVLWDNDNKYYKVNNVLYKLEKDSNTKKGL